MKVETKRTAQLGNPVMIEVRPSAAARWTTANSGSRARGHFIVVNRCRHFAIYQEPPKKGSPTCMERAVEQSIDIYERDCPMHLFLSPHGLRPVDRLPLSTRHRDASICSDGAESQAKEDIRPPGSRSVCRPNCQNQAGPAWVCKRWAPREIQFDGLGKPLTMFPCSGVRERPSLISATFGVNSC